MIGHHHPGAKFVPLTVEKLQRSRNKIGDFRFAQPARAVTRVEQRFHLVAIPRKKLLFLVPRERTFGCA
ncbi:MAG TPA: hypothetical protein VJW76_05775, partial [Verrucomicrobiae bacterium]|nr:hypothetical protein [Verrucomicrobiae bacterium]